VAQPEQSEPVTIARFGSLDVQAAFTEEPWRQPVEALVLPANPDGRLDEEDELIQTFRRYLGSYWPRIDTAIEQSPHPVPQFDVGHPWFVELARMAPLPSSLTSLILGTVHTASGRQPRLAARAIVAFAAAHGIKRLTLPLLGTGKGGPPVETADGVFRAIQEAPYRGSLETVIITTNSIEAHDWLLKQQSPAATVSVTVTSAVPATALLDAETSSLGLIPTDALRELVAVAGRLGPQRRKPNKLITTSLLLFAGVELGTRRVLLPGDHAVQEWAYLDAFVGAVNDMARDGYEKVRSDYFGSTPNPNLVAPAPTFESLSDNTRTIVRAAAEIDRAQGLKTVVLGADRVLMALINSKQANALRNLERMGVNIERLRSRLEKWVRDWSPPTSPNAQGSENPDTTKFDGEVRSEPARALTFVSSFNNDDPRSAASDLIDIEDEVAAFARLAASCNVPPPLSIGVFGNWGSGKTYFMERMYRAVEDITNNADSRNGAFYTEIVQIRFNAWHYIETNLWASLVEYIFNELDLWLRAHEIERPRVDALFDQLATSRQIKLDAYRDLVATRREVKAAEKELDERRTENAEALKGAAASPVANPWPTVAKTFIGALKETDKTSLKEAADQLGFSGLKDSIDELATLVDKTRVQAARSRIIGNALVAELGSLRGAALAAIAVVVAPLLTGWALSHLAEIPQWQWLRGLPSTIMGLVATLSSVIGIGGLWLERARKSLDTLDALRSTLDEKVRKYSELERQRLADAEVKAEQARQAIAEAERRVDAARDREIATKNSYDAESARGRLNRFIRGKVEDASYAKHLGIIASIRKDFGQLTSIMQSDHLEASLKEEIDRTAESHRKKVEALIADAAGNLSEGNSEKLLREDEISDLREASDHATPSFERIILYIDDLDRCPPSKVVEVLQAIHMLLYFPLFVVVVAVDARWVSRALKAYYPDLVADEQIGDSTRPRRHESHGQEERPADAQDYLEKIFQIPYWVRRMDAQTSVKFVKGLAELLAEKRDNGLRRTGRAGLSLTVANSVANDEGALVTGGSVRPVVDTDDVDRKAESASAMQRAAPEIKGPVSEKQTGTPEFIQMTLSEIEKQVIAEFAPFVGGSPRRAKRYVNLYLLLKTSLGLGGPQPTNSWRIACTALMTLLAIVTGPGRVGSFFETLEALSGDELRLEGLVKALERNIEVGGTHYARDAIRKLMEINRRDSIDQGAEMIGALRQFAPVVRRYSF
jgi:hypothetical protein